jgi:hypothetical protein
MPNMNTLYLDTFEEIQQGTIYIDTIETLNDVVHTFKNQNTSLSVYLEVSDKERIHFEKVLVEFLKVYKGNLYLYSQEPISRTLLTFFPHIKKTFKPQRGMLLNSLITRVGNTAIQNKLKEFFKNLSK